MLAPHFERKARTPCNATAQDMLGEHAVKFGGGIGGGGRPRLLIRLTASLLYLKNPFNLSDEELGKPPQVMVTAYYATSMVRTMQMARTKIDDGLMTGSRRRQFSPAFKANLVEQCATALVAGVALEHGINPVTVHRWIRESRERPHLARRGQRRRPSSYCTWQRRL